MPPCVFAVLFIPSFNFLRGYFYVSLNSVAVQFLPFEFCKIALPWSILIFSSYLDSWPLVSGLHLSLVSVGLLFLSFDTQTATCRCRLWMRKVMNAPLEWRAKLLCRWHQTNQWVSLLVMWWVLTKVKFRRNESEKLWKTTKYKKRTLFRGK